MQIQDIMPKVLDLIEKTHESLSASAIRTGYDELDRIIEGLYPGELAVIAGTEELRESFAQNIILNQLKEKRDSSILVISPKMSKERYAMSLLSIISEIPISSISQANPPMDQADRDGIALANETLHKSNIQISDNRMIEGKNDFSEFEKLYSASTLDLIVVDDLESIDFKVEKKPHPTDQSETEVNKNIKTIKPTREIVVALKISILNDIARRFHIPLLVTFNGSLNELDADPLVNVIDSFFSYADLVLELDDERLGQTGLVDINVRKCKHGQIGNTSLYYCDELACFDSADLGDQQL
jgi:replicative DNA helicase